MVLMWLPGIRVAAQHYHTGKPQHYINVSAAGGMNMGLPGSDMVRLGVGGDGQLSFAYEVRSKQVFFSLGLGADYRLTNYGLKEQMVHSFESMDKEGNPILFRYHYTSYSQTQQTVYATVPIWLGYTIMDKVYIAIGAKAALPLWNTYAVRADMYTEGVYVNLIDPISANVPSFAYYPTATYTGQGKSTMPTVYVSPMAEVGAAFDLNPKISCRLGAYVEYALPIGGTSPSCELVDYSSVDVNPTTRTQQNLQQSIRFNSILNANMNTASLSYPDQKMLRDWSQLLSVGVRVTFSFNVTHYKPVCRCLGY